MGLRDSFSPLTHLHPQGRTAVDVVSAYTRLNAGETSLQPFKAVPRPASNSATLAN